MISSLAQRMFDANVRVKTMWWIAGICANPPHEFEQFVEDELQEATEVLKALPWLVGVEGEAEDILSDFAFRNVDGFLVQLVTPMPYDFHKGGYSSTWGRTRTEWFFFPTLEALCERAETWAAEVVEAARKAAA